MPTAPTQATSTAAAVIGLDELATVLGKTPSVLKSNWLKWHQQHGMPRKHPLFWTWPRKAMEVWLTSQAIVDPVPGNDNTGEEPKNLHETRVAEQRAMLHAQMERG